jgi:site-specific recombinase XerC
MLALAPAWDWPRLRSLVLDAVSSPHSKRAYALALDQWFAWARQSAPEGFTKASVQRYRAHLEASGLAAATVNLRLSAVRRLAAEAADTACWRRRRRWRSRG